MRFVLGLIALCSMLVVEAGNSSADPQYSVLYSFCHHHDSCDTGRGPSGELLRDADGNLYGTTSIDSGVVYKLAPDGKIDVLHSFCPTCGGEAPIGGLVMDTSGSLYGVTQEGGANSNGTVFRLSPKAGRKGWTFNVLYNFCAAKGCPDGGRPLAGLTYDGAYSGALYDGVSPLFGTTANGGAQGMGAAFQLTPAGKKGARYKVIYDFCQQDHCTDGGNPQAVLLPDGLGNYYGTAGTGGNPVKQGGVVFKLTKQARKFAYSVVYTFCKTGTCIDGSGTGRLAWDTSGGLIGFGFGGAHDDGVLYQLTTNGETEGVLHDFCSQENCADGWFPNSITVDAAGVIWGTTMLGGTHSYGVVFKYASGIYTPMYEFCSAQNCTDGGDPTGGVVFDTAGTAYGTTSAGGFTGFPGGTIYKLVP